MSGSARPDPDAATAIQGACVDALLASDHLALGAVRDGALVHASSALRRMFALQEGGAAQPFERMVASEDRARVALKLDAPGEAALAFRAARADGSLFEAELTAVRTELPGGPATVIAVTDLTARERAARPLSYLALIDPSTGLPNRGAFLHRAQAVLGAARRAGRPSIAMIVEVEVRAESEPAERDALLRAAGSELQRCVRATDVVARLEPERLAVLLPRSEERGHAAIVATRILAALGGSGCRAAVGVASYPEDADSAEHLLERAETALVEARRGGPGRFAFVTQGRPANPGLPSYVQWSTRYEVGVDVLDGQHRELLEQINRLGDALRSGQDFDLLVETLKELVRYTEHHFGTEERLMDELGARSERHRAEHRRLLDSLMRFTLRLDADGVMQSAAFLQDWLYRHIDEVDRPFAAFLRKHGAG
jgi:hemerythrin-like metal-binding protein/diguanylate cyclase (GGDEF)-like protein